MTDHFRYAFLLCLCPFVGAVAIVFFGCGRLYDAAAKAVLSIGRVQ